MKKLLLAVMASFAMSFAFAQSSSPKLSIGPDVALPVGDAHQLYSVGVGGTLKLEIPVSQSNFNFTVTAGYENFFGKDVTYNESGPGYSYSGEVKFANAAFIPVKVGGKYYASNQFYLEGELGIAHAVSSGDSGTAFAYAPGLGVSLPVDNGKAIDLGVRYEGWSKDGSTFSQVALRLAYKFGL